jgi:hypothetical protein
MFVQNIFYRGDATMRAFVRGVFVLAVGLSAIPALPSPGIADRDHDSRDHGGIEARLAGLSEVPAVSSTGSGKFTARISRDGATITYRLTYRNLEGAVTNAAHIHLGQPDVNGGVSAFLCGGGGKPACPPSEGTVEGVIIAADVVGPAGQGIAATELPELLRAIDKGVTYVNVHTDKHPSGEIRGNVGSD